MSWSRCSLLYTTTLEKCLVFMRQNTRGYQIWGKNAGFWKQAAVSHFCMAVLSSEYKFNNGQWCFCKTQCLCKVLCQWSNDVWLAAASSAILWLLISQTSILLIVLMWSGSFTFHLTRRMESTSDRWNCNKMSPCLNWSNNIQRRKSGLPSGVSYRNQD